MKKKMVLIFAIFLLAAFFRLQNVNWDSNAHLHPDERFLTMVGNAMKLPTSFSEYLDPATSPFNPANIGFPFYVYGVFPVVLNKLIAVFFENDNYNQFVLQGRVLSSIADLLVIVFVFKTAQLFEIKKKISPRIKYWAAFLYAVAVLPIQLSHFFATDTFLNLFMFGSFFYCLKFYFDRKISNVLLSSIFFGLALASKISAIYIFPLILLFFCFPLFKEKRFGLLTACLILFFLSTYATVRFTNPYYFQSSDVFNISISEAFKANIQQLNEMGSGKMWFPPAVQWYSKVPVLFSLFNLSVFGLGLPYFILIIIGTIFLLKGRKLGSIYRNKELLIILLWTLGYFIYNSIQFAKTMRYLIILVPFFSIFAAMGIEKIKGKWISATIILLLIWPIIFTSIYFQKNTRIQASEWIYDHVPRSAVLLSEYWDDALPIPLEYGNGKQYQMESMSVFDPDTSEKWVKMNEQMQRADYYILSSNRGWASIPTVPDKYPLMSKFYGDLFNGKTPYKLANKFIPSYQFLFPFHPSSWLNNWFDESITVYDHPSVFIFKNKNK